MPLFDAGTESSATSNGRRRSSAVTTTRQPARFRRRITDDRISDLLDLNSDQQLVVGADGQTTVAQRQLGLPSLENNAQIIQNLTDALNQQSFYDQQLSNQRQLSGLLGNGFGVIPGSGTSNQGVTNTTAAQINLDPSVQSNLQAYVRAQASAQYGWDDSEWAALKNLIQRESAWNPNAQNPTSTAAGLFQFLDSTRSNYGISRGSPLNTQIDAGLRYVRDRYGTPSRALRHWLARVPIEGRDVGHWY